MRTPRAITLLALAAAIAVFACRPGDDRAAVPGPPSPRDAVVVASFNFPESELVAEIYAGALEAAGVPVHREMDLGPRELVAPALRQGFVDVVPEYVGSALQAVATEVQVDRSDPHAVRDALSAALGPVGLRVGAPAYAQNQNGLAVTRDTAQTRHLQSTSDLREVADRLVLAGPSECPRRPYCLPGLERVYGLHFAHFAPYDSEAQRIAALEQGVADVAVVFTTDGRLASEDLVLLADDRNLQPAEHIVPVMSERAAQQWGESLQAPLDAVAVRLTSPALTFLNWRVAVAGRAPAAEARAWLERQGLAGRTT